MARTLTWSAAALAVVLSNVGTAADVDVVTRALGNDLSLGREYAAWAPKKIEVD